MKKLSVLTCMLLMVMSSTLAQSNNSSTSRRIDESVPQQVRAALEAGLLDQSSLAAAVDPQTDARKRETHTGWPTETCHVLHKGKQYQKREIYTNAGKLLYSKEKIFNKALPLEQYKYIGKHYNGWLIRKTLTVKIRDTRAKETEERTYYKVLLQNGNKRKWQLLKAQQPNLVQKQP